MLAGLAGARTANLTPAAPVLPPIGDLASFAAAEVQRLRASLDPLLTVEQRRLVHELCQAVEAATRVGIAQTFLGETARPTY